jgi:hypothetical protein
MKEYLFMIGEPKGLHAYFKVTAESRHEAVKLANEEIAEENEGARAYFRLRIPEVYFDIGKEFRVDEGMIVDESPASRDALLRAYKFLIEQDYQYSGGEDDLWHDKDPQFTKPIYTEDGEGIYAFFKISARFEMNIEEMSFHFGAVLYPVGGARIADGEGKLRYTVEFRDRQLYTKLDELPLMLEFYESKFLALITALRRADPVDGLPLDNSGPEGDED